jgi:hypothetical protein
MLRTALLALVLLSVALAQTPNPLTVDKLFELAKFSSRGFGDTRTLEVVDKQDFLSTFLVTFRIPEGKRYISGMGLSLEPSANPSGSSYNFGVTIAVITRACFGFTDALTQTASQWLGERLEAIRRDGSGTYQRQFGAIRLRLSGTWYANETVSLALDLDRQGSPATTAWPRYCTF